MVCPTGQACSNADAGACVFTDSSPWIVYRADDDTPGVPELYAVKRDLCGEMTPIKLHEPLGPDETAWSNGWAPDHDTYTFRIRNESTRETRTYLVYFDRRGPRLSAPIVGENLAWSPSHRFFTLTSSARMSIYEYDGAGQSARVYEDSDVDFENRHGLWAPNDDVVFARTHSGSLSSQIVRVAKGDAAWSPLALVTSINELASFELSPDGAALVYQLRQTATGSGPLYAADGTRNGKARLLTDADERLFRWSPDGSRALLIIGYPDHDEAFLYSGDVFEAKRARIAPADLINGGGFSPDSSKVLLWEPVGEWGNELNVLEDDGSRAYDTIGRNAIGDGGARWAADNETGLMPLRADEGSPVELSLVGLTRRNRELLDSIAPDQKYGSYVITPRAEFVAYTKGAGSSFDGAYVDLRYEVGRKPIRLPGEGNVWSFSFDDAGTGLFYIREKDNGARECFYLDLSRQVAAPAVKVSRDGRVDNCLPQPTGP